jgi:hypothetical protein
MKLMNVNKIMASNDLCQLKILMERLFYKKHNMLNFNKI